MLGARLATEDRPWYRESRKGFLWFFTVSPKGRDPGREAELELEAGPTWAGPTQQSQERPPLNWCMPGASEEPWLHATPEGPSPHS